MVGVVLALAIGVVGGMLIAKTIASRARLSVASVDTATAAATTTGAADTTDDDDDGVALLLGEAVDHLEIGVVIAAPSGAIQYRNATAAAFTGTHIGLIVDEHLSSLLAETRAGQRAQRLVELQGPPRSWLEIAADPMPNGGAVTTIRDVSERMRTDAMRTDFVTNISHELKTPVGAVAVLAEALIGETEPDVVHRLADLLVEESHRAVQTIDDLLKLSQIESARPGDDVISLKWLVRSALARGRVVDAGRGVVVSAFDLPVDLWIRGDERQLLSAIGNLVENAVKYSSPGGIVQVRTRADERWVEVMVADQGIGIPNRDLDRVFERFYRVDKARSRETGGTGLGLSIVRHVATNHGGEVLVSSEEGEGSTFVLRLPASLVVDPSITEVATTAPAADTEEQHE